VATIKKTRASETIIGTNENDTIDGAGGNDFIDGGNGVDTAVFLGNRSDFTVHNLSGVVRVTGLNTAPSDYRGTTTKLINVEKIQFLDQTIDLVQPTNNIILANSSSETIYGTNGNDTIDSAGGRDFIDGGKGTDTVVIFGNSTDFAIQDLSGAARLIGLSSASSPYRNTTTQLINVEKIQFFDQTIDLVSPTNNIILANYYSETIDGTAGNDTIDSAGGSDFIDGGNGTDTVVIFGNSTDFAIQDLSGAARLIGLSSASSPYRNTTTQLINVEKIQFFDQTIDLVSPTNNIIFANYYSETIDGTAGNDTIDSAGGRDFIDGGNGTDTVVIFGNSANFSISSTSDGETLVTGLNTAPSAYRGYTATLTNVEKIQFLDTLIPVEQTSGPEGNNYITGRLFSETIRGTAGDDIIDGAGGSDFIDGKGGTDTAVFSGSSTDFEIQNLSGAVRVIGLDSASSPYRNTTTKLINVEKIQFFDETIDLAPQINNIILGNTLSGTINGSSGDDTIDSAGGNDFINGKGGTDTVVIFGNSADFEIQNLSGAVRLIGLDSASSPYRNTTSKLINVEKVQFFDKTIDLAPQINNIILGNTLSGTINGSSGDDTIDSAGGNDFINGKGGTDTVVIFGNSADFEIQNLSGAARLIGLNSAPSVYRNTTSKLINVEKVQFFDKTIDLAPQINNIILSSTSSTNINGSTGDDTIDSAGGSDFIDGKGGTDTVVIFGNSADFEIQNLSGAARLLGLNSAPSVYRNTTTQLLNVEKIQFLDKTIDLAPQINNIILDSWSSRTINGSTGDDTIDSAGGNDFIDGKGGTDTAAFFGYSEDFSITYETDGKILVTGLDSAPSAYRGYTATLVNIEHIQFLDKTVPGDPTVPDTPVSTWQINPQNVRVFEVDGQIDFTITRSDGSTSETVYVSTTQLHGSVNNNDYIGLLNQPIIFEIGQTSKQVSVTVKSDNDDTEGDETFGLIVQNDPNHDPYTYLAATTFTIEDGPAVNQPPTAEPKNSATVDLEAGKSIALSELFKWNDQDGIADVVAFAVKDRTGGNGYLTRDGVRIPDDKLQDDIPVAEISKWAFVAGATGSSDEIGFNAIDKAGAFSTPSAVVTITATASTTPPDPETPVDPTPGEPPFPGQSIVGSSESEIIYGMKGNDEIFGGGGNDYIFGGDGIDTVVFLGEQNGYHIKNLSGALGIIGKTGLIADWYGVPMQDRENIVRLVDVEKLQFRIDENISFVDLGIPSKKIILGIPEIGVIGEERAYKLNGDYGNDYVHGTEGDDVIDGGGGINFIDGGAGTDIAVFFGNRNNFTINNLSGIVQVVGNSGTFDSAPDEYKNTVTKLVNVEKIQFLDDSAPTKIEPNSHPEPTLNPNIILGSTSAEIIYGTSSNDTIDAAGGNDFINGGGGIDTAVFFGNSNDFIIHKDEYGAIYVTGKDSNLIGYGGAPDEYKDFTTTLVDVEYIQFLDKVEKGSQVTDSGSYNLSIPSISGNILSELAHIAHVAYNDFDDNVETYSDNWQMNWRPLTPDFYLKEGSIDIDGLIGNVQNITVDIEKNITSSAHAYIGKIEGKETVVLAFRGTADDGFLKEVGYQVGNWDSYLDAHHNFTNAIFDWVAQNEYQLIVTGHSLGGILTEGTAYRLQKKGSLPDAYFVTFGSPGYPGNAVTYNNKILNFVRTDDPVPWVAHDSLQKEGTTIKILPNFSNKKFDQLSGHGMKEKYIPSIDGYIQKLDGLLGDGLNPIIYSINKGNRSDPLTYDKPSEYTVVRDSEDSFVFNKNNYSDADDLVIIGLYDQIYSEENGIFLYRAISGNALSPVISGVAGLTQPSETKPNYPQNTEPTTNDSQEELPNLFESLSESEFLQKLKDTFSLPEFTFPNLELNQSIFNLGVQNASVGWGDGSIYVLIDEDNDGQFDVRWHILGDYDLDLVQARITDIGLQISYGDPAPLGESEIIGTAADETLVGTDGDDIIRGVAGDNVLLGGGGNDILFGGSGNDVLDGGEGDDRLIVFTGENTLLGGAGNDVLDSRSTMHNTLDGGPGDDLLLGYYGPTTYLFAADWGQDAIIERDSSADGKADVDIIRFTASITPEELTFSIINEYDLLIAHVNGQDSIVILGQFGEEPGNQVERVEFADLPGKFIDITRADDFALQDDLTPNQAPVAVDDYFDATDGIAAGTANLLDNDSDPDGDPLKIVSYAYEGDGELVVTADGNFSYIPADGFAGTDTFSYTIADSYGVTTSASVELNVDAAEPPAPEIELVTTRIGDAPARITKAQQLVDAWSDDFLQGIFHKTDVTDANEDWTAAALATTNTQALSGGDIYAGDLGVSGRSVATSTVVQELDGTEALRFAFSEDASAITVGFSRLYSNDMGSIFSEAGRMQMFDADNNLVGETTFTAEALNGQQTISFSSDIIKFSAVEFNAGAYNENGEFIYGALANEEGSFGSAVYTDSAGTLNGSDFLIDWIEPTFEVSLVGTPIDPAA